MHPRAKGLHFGVDKAGVRWRDAGSANTASGKSYVVHTRAGRGTVVRPSVLGLSWPTYYHPLASVAGRQT